MKAGNADPISIVIPREDEARETNSVDGDELDGSSRKEEQGGSDNRKLAHSRQKGSKTDMPRETLRFFSLLKSHGATTLEK